MDEQRLQQLGPRGLGALLDETFAIYGRHLRRFIILVAIVQAPVGLVSILLSQVFGGGWAIGLFVVLIGALATVLVYGAAVHAVGQQYVTGKISIGDCYARAWHRVLTLVTLTAIFVSTLVGLLWALSGDQPLLASIALVMFIPVFALLVFGGAIQAVVVEGYKATGALRRSFMLIRGNWWRLFGISLVFALVVSGLAILVTIPFALAQLDPTSVLSTVLRDLGGLVVETVALPVLFIGGTLLYYDMRVRKEQFDLSVLSREMGLGPGQLTTPPSPISPQPRRSG